MPNTKAGQIHPSSVNQQLPEQAPEQQSALQPDKVRPSAGNSHLIITLPDRTELNLDTLPGSLPIGSNPLLNNVQWDAVREVLLLPSGLELSDIQTSGTSTKITLADGTTLIIVGHSDNAPLVEIENQTLTALEIQAAFAAARDAEPSAGPIDPTGIATNTEPSSGNSESASILSAKDELSGSGNNFEPISIIVQPSFPITPLLLPSERTQEFHERNIGYGENEPDQQISTSPTSSAPVVNPAFYQGDDTHVYESGLTSGSSAGQTTTSTQGLMNIQNGSSVLQTLEVCDPSQNVWIDVTSGGQVNTPHGTYTITLDPAGTYSWSYTLNTAGDHSTTTLQDTLKVRVTNEEGNNASGNINVNILNDAPVLDIADSPASLTEGSTLSSTWALNPGADGVTHITVSLPGEADQSIALAQTTSATFVLPNGTLTVNPDGTYSFEADANLD
ncbi:hypothetical protein SAMN05421798_108130, partial [Pseudovibrio axinellae]|uniref:Ig-like domain-containing protein n=1 Tax=Pseudovibrio axinellae TaxID=989403 RepID=UPI0008CDE447